MQKNRLGISESVVFLLQLYHQHVGGFLQEINSNDKLNSFIYDPVFFDYSFFDEHWWPLLRFSDIGMTAMKYGRTQIIAACKQLQGKEREMAEYYIRMYSEKETPIDMSDVYHIPENVKNPMI